MFRLTFSYVHVGDRTGGFTENFYVNTDDEDVAEAKCKALGKLLIPLHGVQTTLQFGRVSDLVNNRGGKPVRFNHADPGTSSVATDSDYPTTALLLELTGDNGGTTRQWLKGVPDSQIVKGKMKLSGDYPANFAALNKALTSKGSLFCMRMQDDTKPLKKITGISEAGQVTCIGHGFADEDTVNITGRFTPKYARKRWEIIKVDDDHFKLFGYKTQAGAVFDGKAFAQLVSPVAVVIKEAELLIATSHKVGRPLGQLGGSRPKR